MKTILFLPITFNLAETTRAIIIANAIKADFHCHFASYGGAFECLIEQAGFPLTRLEPRFSQQIINRIYALDHGHRLGRIHSADFVRQMVRSELDLYRRIQPAAVITGIHPTTCISCPSAQIPLVWIIQSGMAMNTGARLGKINDMDALEAVPVRWLPDHFKTKLSVFLLDSFFRFAAQPFYQVAAEYGVKPFSNVEELLWSGYSLLVAEPPGFSDLQFPPQAHFVGPLIARLDRPIPAAVLDLPQDRPIVYFAMGSSGREDVVARILAGFAGKPYRVIAPVKNLLGKRQINVPENVLVTDWLPAHKVNPLADISVIHGGIGTIMTACLSGKPVVGVAMSPEQIINLENLVDKGFAIRLSQSRLDASSLCGAIERLLADPSAQEKAREYQKVIEAWDNPEYVRRFFCEKFG